ncbi:MAG: bifunctional metallophosphatase/5'-nucleotidase [Ruminococcaceae bacterium]|nr:bifunctional metallophosphatase/5'-nucleotidase [Oscillospiraceae bacterium]
MKRTVVRLFAFFITAAMIFSLSVCFASAEDSGDIIVLFTNDVHCATESYALLAAYREEYISQGHTVITVDAGDAIQGKMIGTLTQGEAIVEIMNLVGYDIAIPGNHEFDYKVETLMSLSESAEYEYICANFYDIVNEKQVFSPYKIIDIGSEKIAFVGIATPETYTKSTPAYFQNENGEFIYSFMEDSFYDTIQSATDSAVSEGATRVIAIGHLGIGGVTEGWRSVDLIAGTDGIDAFIDGHAHEIIEQALYKNSAEEDVVLASTGTALNYIGKMTLSEDKITTELIPTKDADISAFSDSAKHAYGDVKALVDGYNAEFDYLFEEIGVCEADLAIYDEDGERLVRHSETNAANFVTDAYRAVLGSDIAFVNGGGVRSEIPKGKFTRKAVMDINPWSNEMCVIEITGRQLLDALEYGTHATPEEFGSFPHSSGITYELHTYIESGVVTDEFGDFVSINENAARRVQNVKVNGEPLEPDKTYTLSGTVYMLFNSGYKMFKDARVVAMEGLKCDSDILVEYVEKHLNGVIPASKYGSIYGDGRITVVAEPEADEPVVPGDESGLTFAIIAAVSALYIIFDLTRKRV